MASCDQRTLAQAFHLIREGLAPEHRRGGLLPLRPRLEVSARRRRQHHTPADAEVVAELFP